MVIARHVAHGQEAQFEELMVRMREAASRFDGHRAFFLIRPEPADDGTYRIVFAFDTRELLDRWMQSAERHALLARIDALVKGQSPARVMSTVESWFDEPFPDGPGRGRRGGRWPSSRGWGSFRWCSFFQA